MKTLVRIDPFSDFRSFAEAMDRMFDSGSPVLSGQTQIVPLDVTETADHLVVRASLPGVAPENVSIQVDEGVLTIAGEMHTEQTNEGDRVYRREIRTGTFKRSLRLPENVNLDTASASHEHGVVTVRLQRIPDPAPRVIKIGVQPTLEATNDSNSN